MACRCAILAGMALLACVTGKALANEAGCRASSKLIGQCFVVHGRLTLANGNPSVRIWQVGTKHMLGVLDSDGNELDDLSKFPREILPLIPKDPWDMWIYGDYTVCPFEKAHPGWMQDVCIAGATHLVSTPLNPTPSQRKDSDAKP